jgi:hypothetical protein
MPQQAQLDREPESVAAAPFFCNQRQVLNGKHVVLRHFGGVSRNSKQTGALFG